MDKNKGGAVLNVLKNLEDLLKLVSWIDFHQITNSKHIRLFLEEKNGALGYVSLTFAEFDGVYKLISKYHSNTCKSIGGSKS